MNVDRNKISDVFTKVLSNAIKYTPEGGEVSVSSQIVCSSTSSELNLLRVIVADTGVGISKVNNIK